MENIIFSWAAMYPVKTWEVLLLKSEGEYEYWGAISDFSSILELNYNNKRKIISSTWSLLRVVFLSLPKMRSVMLSDYKINLLHCPWDRHDDCRTKGKGCWSLNRQLWLQNVVSVVKPLGGELLFNTKVDVRNNFRSKVLLFLVFILLI